MKMRSFFPAVWLGASVFLVAAMKLHLVHFGWLRPAAFLSLASMACVVLMTYICCARFAEKNSRVDLLAVACLIGSPVATAGLMALTGAEIGHGRHAPVHYSDIALSAAAFFDAIVTVAVAIAILGAWLVWKALDYVKRRRVTSSPLA